MTTTIHCPNCGLEYPIPNLDTIRGRKVRCRNCSHVWRLAAEDSPSRQTEAGLSGTGMGSEIDKAEAAASQGLPGSSAPSQTDVGRTIALDRYGADASGVARLPQRAPLAGRNQASAPTAAVTPASLTERRRLGRRQSGFDDVEAAIAALQSSIEQPAVAPVRGGANGAHAPAAGPAIAPRYSPPPPPPVSDLPPIDRGEPLENSPFADDEFEEDKSSGLAAGIAWAVFMAVLAGLVGFAYVDRVAVVRALPGMAAVYASLGGPVNVRGLEFSSIDTQWQMDGHGRPVLSLTGQVKNVSREQQTVPTVVLVFLDGEGRELFDWATPVRTETLPAGEILPFTTVVPAPPEAVRSVEIRFAKMKR